MNEACERARALAARDAVEGIRAEEGAWLDAHLETCEACAAYERSLTGAIRTVRTVSVRVPADLAFRTQYRVSLRAQEARPGRSGWALGISLALSWTVGVASAPWVWRAFEWAGRGLGLPQVGITMAFGLWWAAPALIAVGMWTLDRKRIEEE